MIEINDLEFTYHDTGKIIDMISLSIGKGEKVGLIGPNGAGKTTLFHLICGILKPGSGKINIKGKDVKPGNFNPDVGFVPVLCYAVPLTAGIAGWLGDLIQHIIGVGQFVFSTPLIIRL